MLPSGSFKTKLSLSDLVKIADSVQFSVPLVVKENHLISVLTFCPLNSRNEEEIIDTNPPARDLSRLVCRVLVCYTQFYEVDSVFKSTCLRPTRAFFLFYLKMAWGASSTIQSERTSFAFPRETCIVTFLCNYTSSWLLLDSLCLLIQQGLLN